MASKDLTNGYKSDISGINFRMDLKESSGYLSSSHINKKIFKCSESGEKSSSLYKVGFKPAGPLTII